MSLREELGSVTQKSGATCAVKTLLDSSGNQKEEIEDLVVDLSVPASVLARLLQKHGFSIRANSITRHRRKECCCGNA